MDSPHQCRSILHRTLHNTLENAKSSTATLLLVKRIISTSLYSSRGTDLEELVDLGRVQVREAPVVVHVRRRDKVVGGDAHPQGSLRADEALHALGWDHTVGCAVQVELGAGRLLLRENGQDLV